MLTSLTLKNFKSHKKTDLSLKKITLLTGLNGVGKSSIFQSLLLLRQTAKKSMLNDGLELKGDLCDIGTARDALYQSADNDLIEFELNEENLGSLKFEYLFDDHKQNDTFLKRVNDVANEKNSKLFSNDFQYISAFRNGPIRDYERDTSHVEIFKQISIKEGRCELTAHYLHYFGGEVISDESLMFEGAEDNKLHTNVQYWMSAISTGIQIQVEQLQSSFQISYRYSRGRGKTPTDPFKATNIGFGISYVLPIVIAALHAPKGSLILIENPEAHIHPAGQSRLMELISLSAKNGVQFLIETHSDHIINGALVSVKKKTLSPCDISLYYFDRVESSHETNPHHLEILNGGRINQPPSGFFDQIDIDMKTLMGF